MGQSGRAAIAPQVPVEASHKLHGGTVIHLPQACHDRIAPGKKEGTGQADKLVSRRHLGEVAAPQRRFAGAQCFQDPVQFQIDVCFGRIEKRRIRVRFQSSLHKSQGAFRVTVVRRARPLNEGPDDVSPGGYRAELATARFRAAPDAATGRLTAMIDLTGFSSWARPARPARVVFGEDRYLESVSSSLILGTTFNLHLLPTS